MPCFLCSHLRKNSPADSKCAANIEESAGRIGVLRFPAEPPSRQPNLSWFLKRLFVLYTLYLSL